MTPPLVYVGPTLDRASIEQLLPSAQTMPPIRRGQLYRDFALGFSVFLIIDGVFLESLAVSPREILDVIARGGIVFGASSMGALRAADCCLGGMRGVGSIYRLFRRGLLRSDDEVAVAFAPRAPYLPSSTALVNVRYAVRRAVHEQMLDQTHARRIVEAAERMYFADREWPAILQAAQCRAAQRNGLLEALTSYDLKRRDAVRAVRVLARWLARRRSPEIDHPRRFAALATVDRDATQRPFRFAPGEDARFWRWLVATGEYRRYDRALPAWARRQDGRRRDADELAAAALDRVNLLQRAARDRRALSAHSRASSHAMMRALVRQRSSGLAVSRLLTVPRSVRQLLLAEMAAIGDLDALGLRHRATNDAVAIARRAQLDPRPRDWQVARARVADNHGYPTYSALAAQFGGSRFEHLRAAVTEACTDLALAARVRDALFASPSPRGAFARLIDNDETPHGR